MQEAIAAVNSLHTTFKSIEPPSNVPPPPVPVNPKRSAQINKLRESATVAVRKGQMQEAIRILGFAIDMAHSRPSWEPVGLIREELAACYMARSNAYYMAQDWVNGFKDAQCSTECKKGPSQGPNGERGPGNPRAWTLGAKCLVEMSKWADAVDWLEKGLEIEGSEGDEGREMKRLLEQARAKVINA